MFIDLIVLFLLVVFTLFGVLEGFLVSALKLAAWFLGILAVLLFSSSAATIINANIEGLSPLLAVGIGAILTFLCVFLPLRFAAAIARSFLKKFAVLTFTNHILGGAFGFLKGIIASVLILSVIYLLPAKGSLKETTDKSITYSIYKTVPIAKLWKDFKIEK
ncbi:MAG: CvpA family protein [Fibromonadaceae bacterium]|jgi:uncharacterized membrane protein required for colicin V production|nr:CvpA family protein [Fibromonadaceae bacterium]